MSCCGNHSHDDQNQKNKLHKDHDHGALHHGAHRLMMAICFIVPVAVIAGLFFTGGLLRPGNLLLLAAVLICPLMHLFMMPHMVKKGSSRHH
ncbi:DUF2933 domain-containing protein [Sporolactobacillus sp. THM7-4]|nr:DUF2933 domain-containing protein [Sporolactobacillus sp. THM7-4]